LNVATFERVTQPIEFEIAVEDMALVKCIYSWMDLNQDIPQNDYTQSKEHIVPWAIGGSDGLVTHDASKKYNNDFGSSIDEPFANTLPIAIKRHELGLKSQSGVIPPIVWQLRSRDTNEIGKITIDIDGNVSVKFDPIVVTEDHSSYQRRLVAGSPESVKRIFDGMLKAAHSRNQNIYDPNGDVIESWEDALAGAEIESSHAFSGNVVALDFNAWNRGMFKMALGLAHLVLGPDWTFSADADRLRAVLVNERKDWPPFQGVNPPLPPEIERCLGIDQNVRTAQQHTLIVLPGRQPLAVISLFGGSVPQFAISVGSVLGKFGKLENMAVDQLVGFRVDPTTRKTTQLLVADICRFCGCA
jgi:hypothetical protein